MVGPQTKLAAERGDPIAHALQAAAATRQPVGQAGAVVAQVEQGQRDPVAFADAQAQPEFAGLGMFDRIGRAFLDQPIDRGAGIVVEQPGITVQLGAIDHAGGIQQVADRAFVERAQQAELVQYRRSQIVQQAMQRTSHMRQDGVDRGADVFHAGLVQPGLGQFHVSLDGGDVLTQFVMQLGGQMPALVFIRLQVAASGPRSCWAS